MIDESGMIKTIYAGKEKNFIPLPSWDKNLMRDITITIGENFSVTTPHPARKATSLHFQTDSPVSQLLICDFSRVNLPVTQQITDENPMFISFLQQ